MRINERMKRALSILLCVMMLVQYVPTHAFAATTDNLCEHHTEHTAECGYREGSAGSACTHEHSEDCYAILECLHTCGEECADGCNHECTVDNGCITMELDCHHVHGDCGYSEGTAEVPCGHVHNESCGYAEAVAGTPCANAETDPECDHSGDCGYVAAVEGQPCGHTACDDTCGYAPATEGTPCNHSHAVKVDSADSCYKLLCSHADGGHDDVCGYAAAVEAHECHYECAECVDSNVIANQSADWCGNPLCSQEDNAHVTSCTQYVAPENPQCFCVEKCSEPNIWCDICGFDITGCTGEAKPAEGGKMAISSYSGGTVYVHLTLKAVDVSGNEVSTPFSSYIEQDVIDNREGYGADFYVGDTYCLSGFEIDGYTVKDEEITFTVYSSGNISINSGNASVEYGSGTTYIVIPVNCIGGDRVTIDCSTIDLNVYPYQAWGPGWYADGSVDLHELVLTEPYIFILENSESMTKDNVEYIRILGGAILNAGTLTDGVLVYAENGKIQSGTFISQVNVYADGEICGGTFNNVINRGIVSAGTFNGELTNYGTITNQGNIQLGEDFVLVQNGTVDCNAHIWRDGICRLCSVTCQHSWTNGTCTACGTNCDHSGSTHTAVTDKGDGTHGYACTVCGAAVTGEHTGGTATCTTPAVCESCGASYGEVDTTNHDETVAFDSNGFCPNGCYEPAVLNGEVYEISNAGQLYWFAQQVNIAGNTTANGKLMADIDLENRVWYPIGLYNDIAEANGSPVQKQYAGTFNGNNHTVSNFTATGNGSQGLFGYCNVSHARISNLGVINATVSGWNAGAVAGYCANLTNCYAVGCTITGSSDTNTAPVTISSVGGNNGNTVIDNCWAYDCELIVGEGEADFVMHPVGGISGSTRKVYTVQNCYYGKIVTDAEYTSTTGAAEKTEAQFASGEVAYLLGSPFGQTIGTDTYPGFTGGTVYHGNCGGGVPYSNDAEEVMNHNCNAENGYRCSNTLLSGGVCNVYESASQNAEGYYEIYDASQLYWFAEQVNSGAKSINAVLMNDIDLTNHTWTPIGVTAMGESVTDGYTGTFDGQGHVISNIMFAAPTSAMATGIFGTVQSGGTVKNLGVENLTFDNNDHDHRAGGIAGQLLADSTISDCYVINSTVKASSRVVGGIVGMNRGTVKNCYTCNVTLAAYNNRFGGISGDYSGGKLENCYTDYSALASSEAGTTTNCEAGVSAERFASGEIAYALGDSWGQTIGTDGCPVYGGATVYQVVNIGCPEQGEYVYSNVNEAVAAAHKYTNGFCACGEYEEAVQNTDGYYVIDNAGKLFWFAELVNGGNNTINAVLSADIDLENRPWTPIGTQNESVSPNVKVPYMGVFDGQGHVIKNLSIHVTDGREAGLFGRAQDATLLNFGVVDAAVVSDPVNGTGYRAGIVAGELHRCTVANVYSAGNLTVTTTHAQAGGIAGECADSTLKNCFTTYGCLTASNAALPTAVTNCYYLASSANADSAGTFKTGEQFESGEVAYLLGDAYGQTIGTDVTPNFNGAAVYYGYLSCADDAQPVYSNNGQASEEKPDHAGALTYENNTADGTHIGTYTCCGSTFTEEHTEGTAATCVSNPICSVCKYEYGEPSNSAHVFADDNETCKYCQQIIVAKVSRDGVVSYYTDIADVLPGEEGSNTVLTLLANCTLKATKNLENMKLTREGDVTITVPNGYFLHLSYTIEWIDAEGYYIHVGKWEGRRSYGKFLPTAGKESALLKDLTIENFTLSSGFYMDVQKGATLTLAGASTIGAQLGVNGKLVLAENATLRNTGTIYLWNDIYQSVHDIPAGLTGGSVVINGVTYTYVSGGSTDEKDHAPYWSCNSHVCQDSKVDCITRDHCDHCGDAFGEFGGHTIDITTGSCVLCSEYIAVATVTDGTTTLHADTGENLSTAIKQLMDDGSRTITVDLPGYDMITDVCSAVSDASAGEVRTVHLTVKGLTTIGEDTGFASMTQLATLSLPDVTYLYEYALRYTKLERLELTAEEEITVEREVIDSNNVGLVDLVLCCNKADEVSDGVYWKGFTFKSVTFTEHDYVDGVCTVCGTICDHSGSQHTTAADNEDGTHSFTCSVCGETAKASHTYDNGFCFCGAYEPAVLKGGVYQISNAGQLYWFAARVNGGNTAINAILTKAITVNENVLNEDGTLNGDGSNFRVWTPIGNYDYQYTGTFNGNGKTVSGLYFNDRSASNVGLFGYVSSGTIKHVGVINSYFNGYEYVGGVAGLSGGIVKNCYNTSTVSGNFAGGLVGISFGTVENCYNTGTVSGDTKVEGIVGSPLGKVVNCFNLDTCELTYVGTNKTAEQFASGEVAYLLNGSTSEGTLIWGQTIGTDEYPVLGGAKVYPIYNCSGELSGYTNTQTSGQPQHSYGDPVYSWTEDPTTLTVTVSCTACGETLTGSTTDMDSIVTSDDGFTTTYTATVTLDGKYYTDSKVVSNKVTSVNITWGEMDFTYTDESGWNTPYTAWVQVENTGNTAVTVTYDYVTERTDITGSFFDGTSTVTAPVVIDAEAAKKIWLRLDGTPSEALNNTTIGSVKLTIE